MKAKIILKPEVAKWARNNPGCMKSLCEHTGKHSSTVARWLYTDDDICLRIDILEIIVKSLKGNKSFPGITSHTDIIMTEKPQLVNA